MLSSLLLTPFLGVLAILILAGIIYTIYIDNRFILYVIYWAFVRISTIKWTLFIYVIALYHIKQPFYCFIAYFGFNGIINSILFLTVGWIISYLFKKYIWDRYFITSSIHSLLDRFVLEDLFSLSLIFIPSFAIAYLIPDFGAALVLMYTHTHSTMPELSFQMERKVKSEIYKCIRSSPNNVPFFDNWKKLEIASNALGELKNPSSEQIQLFDVFSERLGPILIAKRKFTEVTDLAKLVGNRAVRDNRIDGLGNMWDGVDYGDYTNATNTFRANGIYNYVTEFSNA